ncbi:leucine-rich repeat serine/threonine-protein kinase 1 [Harmonia axyridis]|uniref:leucine-rich repeat serine/threonine-protein kinase 1 n=1 Tax=Harmonia axyridis TaxID=115357 RepID=UPI001E274E6B|nr:leucine-rich repeat serine/threonine-protein kinase 1 [Harmonia axyridis]
MLDSSPEDEDFPGRLLHQAALWDNTELLEDLLEGGQREFINSQDSWGRTPLHAAAITDNSLCLKILLANGANPNIPCGPRGENKTPLHLSAEHGHITNVSMLLEHNVDLLQRDYNGMTATDLADKLGHNSCVSLLKSAADAREKNRQSSHSALRVACTQGDVTSVKQIISSLSKDAELIINMAPSGANTLLFLACQVGSKDIVKTLLEHGADARYHPITKYSPLYIACYHGHQEIVEILLLRFPELVQQHTVERWLPTHACCINGHAGVLSLLFNFPYPSHVLRKYRDATEKWEYFMPFDINERDASGQNILYLACLLGNKALLDVIISFKVRATRVRKDDEVVSPLVEEAATPLSPNKRRISDGIQSIMSKLNLARSPSVDKSEVSSHQVSVCPLKVDMYCNNNTETALHAAVKGKHYEIVAALLKMKADPNAKIRVYHDIGDNFTCSMLEEDLNSVESTALEEACSNRDVAVVDLLLKNGARDDDCKALVIAFKNKDETLVAKLLSTKAHPDIEFKINKKAMTESVNGPQYRLFSNVTQLTYSAMFPNAPTMINWHNQKCNLNHVKKQWLVDCALHLNPKLKQNPRSHDLSLYAVTRLDISNNSLTTVPLVIFQLNSLRHLNLSQNKIEKLPLPEAPPKERKAGSRKNSQPAEPHRFSCPCLEELYLQDNRLDNIPDEIFKLPALTTLVVSNNKLQQLPFSMWHAAKLKELNVSFNFLKELPTNYEAKEDLDRISMSSSDSQLSNYLEEGEGGQRHLDFDYETKFSLEENIQVRYRQKERVMSQIELTKHHIWTKNVDVTDQVHHNSETTVEHSSQLSALNLAHNLFTSIPVSLSCLAVNLTRLNMAFNSLRSMSHITSYPSSLRQLDLSHNQISCWPSLPQVDTQDVMELANIACYSVANNLKDKNPSIAVQRQSSRSVRNTVLHTVCSHRRHLRLDNLRTLLLANNHLTRIQLTTDDDGDLFNDEDSADRVASSKIRLMFPNLSMLDISNNSLKDVPTNIHELNNLSVLNVSGNLEITDLPPQMGLLSRLWNLNTRGCPLQEPLRSMIESKKYKTMDIIGYLKSVLEDAKPYARMKLMIVGIQGIGKTSLLEQLRQEGITRKRSEHWMKRVGSKNLNMKPVKGMNISTVGVDIGDWIFEKKIRNQSTHGPVIFRTWDFGGQKEYYATHQYFLSKRSLYLVVWKISDGQRGIGEILQWLVNIQARAPNAPVLIVGTHYDVIQEINPAISEAYQQIIRDRFINIVDPEKCGLPRVLDTIEVSCRTRHNVKLLCNLIYDTVFSIRLPGSKELLLEQKVPASYLALEDVVNHISFERKMNGLDPVLNAEQYKSIVSVEMQQRFNRTFRDHSELHQATMFLHDNGVLLHYDDATLKDLYFLDPQWLCDMLAHVVTIREINPFAKTGIMKLDDLRHIFRSNNIGGMDTKGYIVNLLNKFEVALTWDSRTLLIPSLLPTEEEMINSQVYPELGNLLVKVKVPIRSRGWAVRNKKITMSPKSMLYQNPEFQMSLPSSSSSSHRSSEPEEASTSRYKLSSCPSGRSISRLLLMSYFPSGFWSRLISRLLADDTITDIIRSFFVVPKDLVQDPDLWKLLDVKADWILWQTGVELRYGDVTLFRLKEVLHTSDDIYRHMRFRIKQEGIWTDVDLENSSILEIYFPLDSLVVKRGDEDETVLKSTIESTAQLLALAVDHIDILLEDWYPTLGTRFVHTSEGKFLITRLVPCPMCLSHAAEGDHGCPFKDPHDASRTAGGGDFYLDQQAPSVPRKSQESIISESDSGVGHDSECSSRMASVEGHPAIAVGGDRCSGGDPTNYSWMVEECILAAYDAKVVKCPLHGDIPLAEIAPDSIFMDLGDRHVIRSENVKRGRLLGRGAFGFVFVGSCKLRGGDVRDVAMKMLQPVQPDTNAGQSAVVAYKAAQAKWERDPLQYACKAYCTARQELNILMSLKHPHIVPLVGLCTNPLALVLDLAPQGALDLALRHYRRSGASLTPSTLQAVVLQVAKAIEYLHRQRIIYRDLKSENVLVWRMPAPFEPDEQEDARRPTTLIKLADYGISRLSLPSGTKGFGGTEGFMAPEIMMYNGEEEYTEKVDCFSFGMLVYELLTLRQPFEGHDSIKECILEGGRPPLTYRETLYPSYFLDLMVLCWSQQHKHRPTASQIVSIASAPEFTHLSDVVSLKHQSDVVAAASIGLTHITDDGLPGSEMWLMCANSRIDLLLSANRCWMQYHTMMLPIRATATCTVAHMIWIGDYSGKIHGYQACDAHMLFTYALENDASVQVEALLYLEPLKRVACALSNGRLFLVNSEAIPSTPTAAEGTFVMTELGSSTIIYCMCAVFCQDKQTCEIWCGGDNGFISIYTIKDQVVAGHETINHFNPLVEEVNVMNLIAADRTVWSYVQPGCVVYRWDAEFKAIVDKLDCSKLVPCSESLKSIAIEEHLSPTKCQVSSMAVLGNEIYIGTTWGCIIVAESYTLRPITIFRPYEEEVRAIVPLSFSKNSEKQKNSLIATIGRGYRNLLTRYTDVQINNLSNSLTSPTLGKNSTVSSLNQNMFVLLWRARDWNAV